MQSKISAIQRVFNIFRGVFLKYFMPKNWLSYKIEKKPNLILIRQALDECEKELSTPIPEFITSGRQPRFLLRIWAELIKHWILTYVVSILASILIMSSASSAKDVLNAVPLLTMLASILVIGIPIITTFAMFRTGGKWGQESLHHNTKINRFVFLSLVTLLLAIANAVFVYGTRIDSHSGLKLTFTGIVLGLAVGTFITSAAIIMEVLKFARNPVFAWRCAGRYATHKFLESCLLDMHVNYFMHEYHNILDDIICEKYEHLAGPSKYLSTGFLGNETSIKKIFVAKPFHIEHQYVDYYLPYLSDMNRLASENSLKLNIPHHTYRENKSTENMLVAESNPATITVAVDEAFFVPRCDKYLLERRQRNENEDAFLRQVATTLEGNDRFGFRMLFESIRNATDSLATIWGNEAIRRMAPARSQHIQNEVISGDDLFAWAKLYSDALKLLLYNPPAIDHAPYSHQYQFMRCLRECYQKQIISTLESGQPDLMSIFLRHAPNLYKITSKYIMQQVEAKGSVAIEGIKDLKYLSAQWGRVFAYIKMYYESIPPSTSNSDRVRFLVYLQRTASDWIVDILSPESKDYENAKRRTELLQQLCKAMGDIIDISFDCVSKDTEDARDALLHTHWWITGSLLIKDGDTDLQNKQQEILEGLCSSKLLQQSPQELLEFYCKHQQYEERLGRQSHFEDNMREKPLDGGASGSGYADMYHDEMRGAFLFFMVKCESSNNYSEDNLPDVVPVNIRANDFDDEIEKVRKAGFGYSSWIKNWLELCEKSFFDNEQQKIIEAELDPTLKCQFIIDFDKGFQEGLTVIQAMIDGKRFKIQEDTHLDFPDWNWINKKFFLPQDEGGYGLDRGNEFGRNMAKSLDRRYFSVLKEKLTEKSISSVENVNISQLVEFAVDWLKGRGCSEKDGLILCSAKGSIRRILAESEAFVPAWRKADLPKGYIGTYHGFRVWGQNSREEQEITVIAVDLSKWEPIIFGRKIESTGNWWQSTIIPVDDKYIAEIEKNRTDGSKPLDKKLYLENCRLEVEYDIDFNLVDAGEHCMLFCSKEETADTGEPIIP